MIDIPEIGGENPETGTLTGTKVEHCHIRYRKPISETLGIPNCMLDAPETGTVCVPVFGADFWYVCHWH